jgi:hypothetical protein
MLLVVGTDGKKRQTLVRAGACHQKAAIVFTRGRDWGVTRWDQVTWRTGDRQVDIASWSGGEVALLASSPQRNQRMPQGKARRRARRFLTAP